MKLCSHHERDLAANLQAAGLGPFCAPNRVEMKRRGYDYVEKKRWTKYNFEPVIVATAMIVSNYHDAVKGTAGTRPLDPALLQDMADGAVRCPICTLEDHWGPRPPNVPSWPALATGGVAELARELGLL